MRYVHSKNKTVKARKAVRAIKKIIKRNARHMLKNKEPIDARSIRIMSRKKKTKQYFFRHRKTLVYD